MIIILGILCLWPKISAGIALLLGVLGTLLFGNPYEAKTKKFTPQLLTYSVIGLGAGMNLLVVLKVGLHGILYTVVSIGAAFAIGTILGLILKVERDLSLLLTVGTAICGGSAIAAVAPVLGAKPHQVSVSLGTVFMLNACALFLFPWLGHHFSLTQNQFGLWSALAIHDTSSVVGSTLQYGQEALQVGTTVKLARALWIVPVTFAVGFFVARRNHSPQTEAKPKRPWFILGFLLMAALVTWIPALAFAGHIVEFVARRLLVLTLFLIGANLSRETLKAVGFRPFLQGVLLWIAIGTGSLFAIVNGWMN